MVNNAKINRYQLSGDDSRRFFRSDASNFLIFKTAVVSVNKPSGQDSVTYTVNHNLGYEPAVFLFAETQSGEYIPIPFSRIVAATWYETITGNVDTINIYIVLSYADPAGFLISPDRTIKIRYYILREKIK